MEVTQTDGGILIPKQPEAEVEIPFPVSCEIEGEEDRVRAREALKMLWDAMHLTEWSVFWNDVHEARDTPKR